MKSFETQELPVEGEVNDGEKFSGSYVRHSKAQYKTYSRILGSSDPMQSFDKDNQEKNDLPEAGIELARREAVKYFEGLDPLKDRLFFTSSNEARTMETANVYREVAKSMGFQIIKPEHSRSKMSDEIAEGEIRSLDTLSINSENVLLENVFNPANRRGVENIDWSKVPEDVKKKFDQAIIIVDADDKGSWGANFAKHSEAVNTIIPEIKTAKEQFEHKFINLLKLFKLGQKISQDSDIDGNIKVLAFGHENIIIHLIQNSLMENELKNCEVVEFVPEDDTTNISFKGKSVNL